MALSAAPHVSRAQRRLDDFQTNLYQQPEKMLVLAVLEDAIACFQNFRVATDVRDKKIFSEARTWLWSDRYDWPFSYRNICDVLGIDASYLRQGLARWKHERYPAKITDARRASWPMKFPPK